MSKRRMVILVGILAVVWSSVAQAFAPQAQAFPLGPGTGDIGLRTTFVMWQGNFPCGVDMARAKFKLRLEPDSTVTFGFEQPAQGISGPTSTITNPYDYGMNVTVLPGYHAGASYYVQAQEKPGQFRITPTTGSVYSVSDVQVWAEGDPERDCTPWTAPTGPLPTQRPAATPAPTPSVYVPITPEPDPMASGSPSASAEYCIIMNGLDPIVIPCADPSWQPTASPTPTPAPNVYDDAYYICSSVDGWEAGVACNMGAAYGVTTGYSAVLVMSKTATCAGTHIDFYGSGMTTDMSCAVVWPATVSQPCYNGPNSVFGGQAEIWNGPGGTGVLFGHLHVHEGAGCVGVEVDPTTLEPLVEESASPSPSPTESALPPWAFPPIFNTPSPGASATATLFPGLTPSVAPQPPATANPGINPGQPASGWFYPTTGFGGPPNFGGCEPSYPKPGQLPSVDMGTAPFPGATLDLSRWLNWIGSLLTLLPKAIMNTAISIWNAAVDAIVPGTCLDDILGDRVDTLMGIGPFALYSEVEDEVNAALDGADGSVPGWCVPLWGGGEYCLPLGEWAAVTADIRTASGLFVWLLAAIAAVRIVVGSFRVGRGSMHIDADDPVIYLKGS